MENKLIGKSNLAPLLTPKEQEIVLAHRETKVANIKPIDLANAISNYIKNVLIVLGHVKNDFPDRAAIELNIVKDIQYKFKNLTLKEIEIAFYMGSRGEFKNKPDEIVFLSVATVYNWLSKYQTDIKRSAMKKQIDFEAKYEVFDKEQKNKEAKELIIKSLKNEFNDFLEDKEIYDPLNVLYNFLDSEGLINLSIDRKKEIYQKAKKRFKEKHSKSATIGDYAQNKKILQEMEAGSDRIESLIKIKAKQAALKEIFQDIKELGMTIEEFLNEQA